MKKAFYTSAVLKFIIQKVVVFYAIAQTLTRVFVMQWSFFKTSRQNYLCIFK